MILHRFGLRSFSRTPQLMSSNKKIQDLLENAALGPEDKLAKEENWSTSSYPERTVFSKRDQSKKSKRPRTDPRETSIILFPGQGAQYVGMAKSLVKIPEAADMYNIASEVLGYDLLKLCNEGPQKKLDRTVYAQPAIAVTSLASLAKLEEERPNCINSCVATAGFSLGEISALIFAGAIPFEQGIKLIQVRAQAMQVASEANPSGMATVLYGADSEIGQACVKAKEWCLERGVENPECKIANYLFPHCKVVAGSLEALNFLEKNSKQFKLRRVKQIPVSGAFHTNLMESAVEPFTEALKKIRVSNPLIPVHSCIDGKPYRNAEHIRKQLPKQIIKSVRWEQLLHIIYERPQGDKFPRTYECAPGVSLTAILKNVNAKAWNFTYKADGDPMQRIEKKAEENMN